MGGFWFLCFHNSLSLCSSRSLEQSSISTYAGKRYLDGRLLNRLNTAHLCLTRLFLAIVGVSSVWRWKCFAGIVSFLGISRPGEPLRAVRRDLVLPRDRMEPLSSVAYLRVGRPKARRRAKNLVQHITIDSPCLCRQVSRLCVWGPRAWRSFLFYGSPSAFRRRWNSVLSALRIPRSLSIRPGGLRGGGCISLCTPEWSYQNWCGKWDWNIRAVLNLTFNQECVASTILPQVSDFSRRRDECAADLSRRLLQLWCAILLRPEDH